MKNTFLILSILLSFGCASEGLREPAQVEPQLAKTDLWKLWYKIDAEPDPGKNAAPVYELRLLLKMQPDAEIEKLLQESGL